MRGRIADNQKESEDYAVKKKVWFPSLLLILLVIQTSCADWSGKVVSVADGDTITVLRDDKQVRIRLYGIDSPERGQAFSRRAREFTSEMVLRKTVKVTEVTTDQYGRTVALVSVGQQLLNKELVKAGYAWVYDYYCSEPICESWRNFQLRAKFD